MPRKRAPSTRFRAGALRPQDCPRWESCACPICPLDDWRQRTHLPGERVCAWLRELAKPGGTAVVADALGEDGARQVAEAAPAIADRWSDIRHKLKQASRQGSKGARSIPAKTITDG